MSNYKSLLFSSLLMGLTIFAYLVSAAEELEVTKKDDVPTFAEKNAVITANAAEQGDASAQFKLGLMYDHGYGAPEDGAQAMRWYRMAAEQGHDSAQFKLGNMYANGEGVPEDDAEAVRWYRMAAEQGHVPAQNNLGVMYAGGEGVPEDNVQAYAWYSIAAAQGDKVAKQNKERTAKGMTRSQIAEAQKLSRKYWETYGPNRKPTE